MSDTIANVRSFAIRPATAADIGQIHALIQGLAQFEQLEHACIATTAQLADALFGPEPAAEVLIAYETGENATAAGFALFFQTYSTFLGRRGVWLEDLFVRPAVRGRGLGRALLTAVARIARQRGCGRFEWSVLDWNESAIRFYERLGAAVMPDWRIARVTGAALDEIADGVPNQPSGASER